jgi:hypothetical protein
MTRIINDGDVTSSQPRVNGKTGTAAPRNGNDIAPSNRHRGGVR